ncbi:hypothetical protein NEUTE2DRAFT_74824 [Neurospora tetrasperma FGSC 2509]|nr:hypothetical protein NEUTE2DRAFT_74824 [Neurospora tetrasperma FGSC 2509]
MSITNPLRNDPPAAPAMVDVGLRPTTSGGTLLRATAPIDITSRHHHTLSTHHPLHERSSSNFASMTSSFPSTARRRGAGKSEV